MSRNPKDEIELLEAKRAELKEQVRELNKELNAARNKKRIPDKISEQLMAFSSVYIKKDGNPMLVLASSGRSRRMLVPPPLTEEEKHNLIEQFKTFIESIDQSYLDRLMERHVAWLKKRQQLKARQSTPQKTTPSPPLATQAA